MTASTCDILLIGGGHSHVAVLADWARRGLPAPKACLLTPLPHLQYSGMVPGWISGEHARADSLVDLAGLAERAGVELVLDRCVALDPQARSVLTQKSGVIGFTTASIDIGGVGQAARVLGDDPRLLDVRPMDRFIERLSDEMAKPRTEPMQVAVIGGGAGGFELAFALRNMSEVHPRPEVSLILGEDTALKGLSRRALSLALKELWRQGIAVHEGNAAIQNGQVVVAGKALGPFDLIVAAVGSGAADWPRLGGLETDMPGFIAVDEFQRSVSHPFVFAAGDCARRVDQPVPHSGVHAVHTGPVLAANLRTALAGREPDRSYRPRPTSLYLLSTGNGQAIASYGALAAQGRWASRLKAWIDKRWLATYAALSEGA
ncbi:MAG: FAD-dependent oxidoreductase [Pseudomonadota bacterium]